VCRDWVSPWPRCGPWHGLREACRQLSVGEEPYCLIEGGPECIAAKPSTQFPGLYFATCVAPHFEVLYPNGCELKYSDTNLPQHKLDLGPPNIDEVPANMAELWRESSMTVAASGAGVGGLPEVSHDLTKLRQDFQEWTTTLPDTWHENHNNLFRDPVTTTTTINPEVQALMDAGEFDVLSSSVAMAPIPAGATIIQVADNAAFNIGDTVLIGELPKAEIRRVVGKGSIILDKPLVNSYPAGVLVQVIKPPGGALAAGAPAPGGTAFAPGAAPPLAPGAAPPAVGQTPPNGLVPGVKVAPALQSQPSPEAMDALGILDAMEAEKKAAIAADELAKARKAAAREGLSDEEKAQAQKDLEAAEENAKETKEEASSAGAAEAKEEKTSEKGEEKAPAPAPAKAADAPAPAPAEAAPAATTAADGAAAAAAAEEAAATEEHLDNIHEKNAKTAAEIDKLEESLGNSSLTDEQKKQLEQVKQAAQESHEASAAASAAADDGGDAAAAAAPATSGAAPATAPSFFLNKAPQESIAQSISSYFTRLVHW